jgi:hypothetical protein
MRKSYQALHPTLAKPRDSDSFLGERRLSLPKCLNRRRSFNEKVQQLVLAMKVMEGMLSEVEAVALQVAVALEGQLVRVQQPKV